MCNNLTTRKEASTTPGKAAERKQKGTPLPDWDVTHGSELRIEDDDNTVEKEYMSSLLQWLGLNPDWKRMLDDETNMLAHHNRKIGNNTIHILQQAVDKDPESFKESWAQIT